MASGTLQIRLLGAPQMEFDGKSLSLGRKKLLGLLVYLLVQGRSYTRDFLATLFWPEAGQQQARGSLRRILSEITRNIPVPIVILDGDLVSGVSDLGIELDINTYVQLLDTVEAHRQEHAGDKLCVDCVARLREAVDLYRGDFMEGYSIPGCVDFSGWQIQTGENLKKRCLEALDPLLEAYLVDGDYEQVANCANRIIELDPLREDAYTRLIEVYAKSGRTALAMHIYERLKTSMKEELGAEPGEECRRLVSGIRTRKVAARDDSALKYRKLPHPISTFVGRETELDGLCESAGEHRLVTVVGMGGMGKTRLSLEAGNRLLDSFDHGVAFVDLVAAQSREDIIMKLLSALELKADEGEGSEATCIRFLSGRNMLLILDNCEQVIDAGAEVAGRLLEACPEVHVLATSRESLRVDGEHIFQVAGLALPDRSADPGMTPESVLLFQERARAVDSTFLVNSGSIEQVENICRCLEGIPLALEIAAARLRSMSIAELDEQIQRRIGGLENTARGVDSRHQSLRSVLDWSFALLDRAEEKLITSLSLFPAGFSAKACGVVCIEDGPIQVDGDPVWAWLLEPGCYPKLKPGDKPILATGGWEGRADMYDLLGRLVDKSLLTRRIERGRTRYSMLETVRQYASERLAEREDVGELRSRYVDFYVFETEEFQAGMINSDQAEWLSWSDVEIRNITLAVHLAVNGYGTEKAARIISCLWPYWNSRGNSREGYRILEEVLERKREIRHLLVLAKLYLGGGQIAFLADRRQRALELFTAAKELAAEQGMDGTTVWADMSIGQATFMSDPPAALPGFTRALEFFTRHDHYFGVFIALRFLGYLDAMGGDPAAAREKFIKAYQVTESSGDLWFRSQALAQLAALALDRGAYQEVVDFAGRYFDLHRLLGGDRHAAGVHLNLGIANLCLRLYDEAYRLLTTSISAWEEHGRVREFSVSAYYLGWLCTLRGDIDQAHSWHTRGLQASLKMAVFDNETLKPLMGYAWLLGDTGKPEEAAKLLAVVDEEIRKTWHLMAPREREYYDECIEKLKNTLTDEEFSNSWQQGLATDAEAAIRALLVDDFVTTRTADRSG